MQTQARIAVGWVFAALAAAAGAGTRASAQNATSASIPLSSNQWNTFTVDVAVHATRVAADGAPIGVSTPPLRYRWERSQSGAGWKTTMTIADRPLTIGEGRSRREVDNPFAIARIEDDEDGSPLRMYRKDGGLVTPPSLQLLQRATNASGSDSAAAVALAEALAGGSAASGDPGRRRFVGGAERAWVGAFVATPQDRTGRRTRLTMQFARKGQLRGLDRFTRVDGDTTQEILADPQAVVPVEINLLQDRTLLSHSTIGYDTAADGSLVRRAMHTERALPTPNGERAVVDTTYANVRVERRR